MFLRIGERVAAAEFGWFVDVDRKAARHPLSADSESFDLRSAVRLPLPGRRNAPVCHAGCGLSLDALDQGEEVGDIDAVDDIARQ